MDIPDRLAPTVNDAAVSGRAASAARRDRRMQPTFMVVEPEVNGMLESHAGLQHDVPLLFVSLPAEGRLATASGPLPRGRITAAEESAAGIAGRLGYDFVLESEIRVAAPQCLVRIAIIDTTLRRPAAEFTTGFDPRGTPSLVDAIAGWMHGRIEAAFAGPRRRPV